MTTQPRDYDAELEILLKIIHEHSKGLSFPSALTTEDADAGEPILMWVVENSQGEEQKNASA